MPLFCTGSPNLPEIFSTSEASARNALAGTYLVPISAPKVLKRRGNVLFNGLG